MSTSTEVLPLLMGASGPIVDRNKRDIRTPGQWLRELKENADEAGAKNIHFGIEWQGVTNLGVYRRLVADDGRGMDDQEINQFMRTYGGGGKPIGAEHENFGIGAKVTLLPWNREGIVVISYKDGLASMIRLKHDRVTNEYGAYIWTAESEFGGDEQLIVVSPDEFGLTDWGVDDFGSIWKQVPFWADKLTPPEHGTIVLLIGNDPLEDTILGDPDRPEERTPHFPARYLNTRIWQVPDHMTITVDVPTSPDKNNWPHNEPEQIDLLGKCGITRRPVKGAHHYIHHVGGSVAASSEMEGHGPSSLGHNVVVHWFLRTTPADKRANPYGPRDGMVAVLYDNELYDISSEPYRFRQFGIRWKEVQKDTYLIVEPPRSDGKQKHGVYPLGGRDALNLYGGKGLPFGDWGMTFAAALPEEIQQRLKEARPDDEIDRSWKEKFAERFLKRWREQRLRVATNGEAQTEPVARSPRVEVEGPGTNEPVSKPKRPKNARQSLTSHQTTADRPTGTRKARKVEMAAAIPDWVRASANDMDEPYYIAAFDETRQNDDGSRGAVLVNTEHEAIIGFIAEFQAMYPPQAAEQVEAECLNIIGQSLVAKVVHAQSLSAHVPREDVMQRFLSPVSLTTAALGMVFESEGAGGRIGGVLGIRKAV
jgi:hypothetical protein